MAQRRKFKTKRKVSGGKKEYKAWKEFEDGDWVVGEYLGTHKDQYDKECRIIMVEDCEFADDSGEKYIGKNLVLNAAGMLDRAWDPDKCTPPEIGDIIQVTYGGTSKIEEGKYAGKDSHMMEVEIMQEDDGSEYEDEETEEDDDL